MTDWNLIDTAPVNEPVIVTDGQRWTLARQASFEAQTLQLRWPFLKYETLTGWVFSCSGIRKIDFAPTHWLRLDLTPPKS